MAVRNHKEFVAYTLQLLNELDDFIVGKQFACLTDVFQFYQRIGAYELHLQVGQRMDAVVVGSIISGLLLAYQRYKETQAAYLYSDGLQVNAINTVFNEIEFAGIVRVIYRESKHFFSLCLALCLFLIAHGVDGVLVTYGVINDHLFPDAVIAIYTRQQVRHLLEHTHRECTRAAGWVEHLATEYGIHQPAGLLAVKRIGGIVVGVAQKRA